VFQICAFFQRTEYFPLFRLFECTNMSSMKLDTSVNAMNPLEAKAEEVAATLTAMANPKRLVVMCTLLAGEKSVGELAEIVQLSPAALSQHLGKMRALRLVSTRRDGQTIYYSLASAEVQAVLETLYRVYCAPEC
jgi:ArsR family transcriptional regulator, virulence genes transcriptional regulator